MWNLLFTIDGADLIQSLYAWRETTVYAKDATVNDGRQTQIVKDFSAVSPNCNTAVFAETLIIKTVNLSNLSRLVVASYQSNSVWISHLKCKLFS